MPKVAAGKQIRKERKKDMTQITQRVTKEMPWKGIVDLINRGEAAAALQVEDVLTDTMKDGTQIAFEVAHIAEDGVYFVMKDCSEEMQMNTRATNRGGWKETGLRKYLNSDMLDQMPDDLKEAITERTIRQVIGEKEYISQDKLWIPSVTEVFGEIGEDVEEDGFQFDIFKDRAKRIKRLDGGADNWWLRSPHVGHEDGFYHVNSGGSWNNNWGASHTIGVAVGFCIKKSE